MEVWRLLDELLGAAHKLGLEVRVEPFDVEEASAGGICKVRGRTLILLDENAPLPDRTSALANALSCLDHETVYMSPEARRFVYQMAERHQGS